MLSSTLGPAPLRRAVMGIARLPSKMLPSFTAIRAFEATARTGSVRAAARELNVVHGAVSQQIRALEEAIGRPLFRRAGRQMQLNRQGEEYARAISTAFSIISRATEDAMPRNRGRPFRLAMRSAFASYWFMPRYGRFLEADLGLDLEIVEEDRTTDLVAAEFDALIVSGGHSTQPEVTSLKFMDAVFGPVMSPALLPEAGNALVDGWAEGLRSLCNTSNVHLWDRWFYETGRPVIGFREELVLASLGLVIEAARAGVGLAIVPVPHVASDLAAGRLVAPFGTLRTGGYFLRCAASRANAPEIRRLLGWLEAEGERMLAALEPGAMTKAPRIAAAPRNP